MRTWVKSKPTTRRQQSGGAEHHRQCRVNSRSALTPVPLYGRQADALQRDHCQSRETHQGGLLEIAAIVTQAATDRSFNEAALRQSLSAIATWSHTRDEDV